MILKYHLFLSCEDISVSGQKIEDVLNKNIEQNRQTGNNDKRIIECVCRYNNDINQLKSDLDDLEKSFLYVVNTHEELDNINYWEIGYAMGKGIKIIGYSDGESEKKIPKNLENLINVPENIDMFIKKIRYTIPHLDPIQDIFAQEWPEQLNAAKKEFKGEY